MNKNNMFLIILVVILSCFTISCEEIIQYFQVNTNISTREARKEKCPGICQQRNLSYAGTYKKSPWQCGCK